MLKKRYFKIIIVLLGLLLISIADADADADDKDNELIKKFGYPYYTGEIIPTPQKKIQRDTFIEVADAYKKNVDFCLMLEKNAVSQAVTGAEQIKKRFAFLNLKINVITEGDDISPYKTIINIKNTNMNTHPQGYDISIEEKNGRKIINCFGHDGMGTYYACATLNQLFKIKNGKIFLREAEINDWPEILTRTCGIESATPESSREALFWAADYKISTMNIGYLATTPWYKANENVLQRNLLLLELAQQSGIIDISYHINPYFPGYGKPATKKINISSIDDINALVSHFRTVLEHGAKSIMLMADDFVPAENRMMILSREDEKQKFKTLENAHVYMVNTVYEILSKEFPGMKMYFCPPYYSLGHISRWAKDPEAAIKYINVLSSDLNKNIGILFCGRYVRSAEITEADMNEIKKIFNNRIPYIWDNTCGHYSMNSIMEGKQGGYFKPFSTEYCKEILPYLIVHNSSVCPPANWLIRMTLISAGDMLWNPAAYNPEKSLRNALNSYAGCGSADSLIEFGNLCTTLSSDMVSVNTDIKTEKVLFQENFEDGLKSHHGWISFYNAPHIEIKSEDTPSGKKYLAAEVKEKQYILRTGDKDLNIPFDQLISKGIIEFDWKTDNPTNNLRIVLVANGTDTIFLDKQVSAQNTIWTHFTIPVSNFQKNPDASKINYISGIRFGNSQLLSDSAIFELDNIRISIAEKPYYMDNALDKLMKMKNCINDVKKICFNQILLENLDKIYTKYEKDLLWIEKNMSSPLVVQKILQPPALNGTLDDKCWDKAEKTSGFVDYKVENKKITETWVKAVYDENNLYIAFYCRANKWDPQERLSHTRDSISNNDSIEFFIDQGLTRTKYYHFRTNIIGTLFDRENAGLGMHHTWDPEWDVKTFKGENFWSAEMKIPFKSLNTSTPKKGDIWGANFCRNYFPETEIGTWKSTQGNFHNPLLFGSIIFQ